MKPICYDLFSGLGGWSEAFLAEGYRCVGFDIEAHEYGDHKYPGELVLRDVRSIHGSELKDATVIVASPPCQEYSYMAMPWSKAKAKRAAILADKSGAALARLNQLFSECFRIQREAIEAAGHFIPMVVENVRGAQEWVGRARWNYGSFYLWGDVPALMPMTFKRKLPSGYASEAMWKDRPIARLAHQNPQELEQTSLHVEGQKVPGFRFDGSGRSFQTASVEGVKQPGIGHRPQVRWSTGADNFGWAKETPLRNNNSKSNARKAASAMIACIPFPLAQWIANAYYPRKVEAIA